MALIPLILLGLWRTIRMRSEHASVYHAMQVALPLAAFFTIAVGLLHVRLPAFEWKQFIILSPSLFILFAFGADQLQAQRPRWAGNAIALAVSVLVVYASVLGLQRYWSTQKSPEGVAAQFVRDHMQPGDAVVSQHYSLNAALSFYLPDVPHYTKPQVSSDSYLFSQSLSILQARPIEQASIPLNTIIGKHPRIWLLSLAPSDAKLVKKLGQFCKLGSQQPFGPFRVTLLENCNSHTKTHL
jgi:hypothetical protein